MAHYHHYVPRKAHYHRCVPEMQVMLAITEFLNTLLQQVQYRYIFFSQNIFESVINSWLTAVRYVSFCCSHTSYQVPSCSEQG